MFGYLTAVEEEVFRTVLWHISNPVSGAPIRSVLGLVPVPTVEYLTAIVGAFVTLWAWRNR